MKEKEGARLLTSKKMRQAFSGVFPFPAFRINFTLLPFSFHLPFLCLPLSSPLTGSTQSHQQRTAIKTPLYHQSYLHTITRRPPCRMATLIRPDKLSQGSIDINSHRRVISELFSGRDSAVQLQDLLQKDFGGQGSVLAWEMAEKILRSFTESISMLSSTEAGEVCDDGGSIDWGASKKRPDSGTRNGRGCYKRR